MRSNTHVSVIEVRPTSDVAPLAVAGPAQSEERPSPSTRRGAFSRSPRLTPGSLVRSRRCRTPWRPGSFRGRHRTRATHGSCARGVLPGLNSELVEILLEGLPLRDHFGACLLLLLGALILEPVAEMRLELGPPAVVQSRPFLRTERSATLG